MPRYYFHVKDGKNYRDLQGTELADTDAARREALRFTGDLLNEGENGFWDGVEWSMEVTDAIGSAFFTLRFTAAEV